MKKYTREQVKTMTRYEYELAISKELNDAGFRREFQGEKVEYEPYGAIDSAIVFDSKAVDYLKDIGLIDNGKCPMCSQKEDELEYRLQNQRSRATYHVCKSCYKRYAREEREKRAKGCCLIIIVMIALIIWGIVKLIS